MKNRDNIRIQCEAIVEDLGLGRGRDITQIEALLGGVSSDIVRVCLNGRDICLKFALPQLKVAALWTAPIERNLAEYRWLEFAASLLPNTVPALLGHSERVNGFAMAYLDPQNAYNYKQALLSGKPDTGQAGAIGQILATIHAASSRYDFDRSRFDNSDSFHALRVEPYLLQTASCHPTVATELRQISDDLDRARITLVHGDVSPKNLLISHSGPIFLDAECASFGDPAFDTSFFLNHLLLKAVHMPANAQMLMSAANQFWDSYEAGIVWEQASDLRARTAKLLPALMLARVDGKSPVEYLSDQDRERIRRRTLTLIESPLKNLPAVMAALTFTGKI